MTFTVNEPLEAPAEFFYDSQLQPKQLLFGVEYTGDPSTTDIETRHQQLCEKWSGQESILTILQAARDFLTFNSDSDEITGILRKGAFGRVQTVVQEVSDFKLQCPNIAIIGGENQGKSSVLERIVKHAIFPRDRRTSTMLPITFKLYNIDDDGEPSIKVRRISVDDTEIYHEDEFQMSDSDARIYAAVEAAQTEAMKNVKEEKVEVFVKAKDVPDLVFVDYPGLTCSNAKNKTRIQELTEKAVAQPDTLLVFVTSATSESLDDIAVAGMLQDHFSQDDPWKRSVCILTKCDKVSGFEIDITDDRLCREGDETDGINCEIVGVVNRDTEMTKRTGRNMNFEEARWQEFLWYKMNLKRCDHKKFGIDAVLMNLNKLIEDYVVEKWVPDQIAEIDKKQDELEEELIQLGRRPSLWLCKQMISEVRAEVWRHLRCSREGNFVVTLVYGSILREIKSYTKFRELRGPVVEQVSLIRELDRNWSSKSKFLEVLSRISEDVINAFLEVCNSSALPTRFERFKDFKTNLENKLKEILLSRIDTAFEISTFAIRNLKCRLSSKGKLQYGWEELESVISDQIASAVCIDCIVPGMCDFLKWLENLDGEVEEGFLGNENFDGCTNIRAQLNERIIRCIQAKSTIRFQLLKYDTKLGIDQEILAKICSDKFDVITYMSYVTQVLQKIESSDNQFCHEMVTKLCVPHDLLSVMKFFLEGSVELQIKSIDALWNLCRTNQIRQLLAGLGSVDRCVLALERYGNNAELREISKKFLKCVACNRDALPTILKLKLQGKIASAFHLKTWDGEWRYFFPVLDTVVLGQHSKEINSVALNQDGTLIVSSSTDNTIRVWDARTGKQISVKKVETRNSGAVVSVAFNHDSTNIVSVSKNGYLRFLDAITGKHIKAFRLGNNFSRCSFSHDGSRVVSPSHNSLRIFDAETGASCGNLGRYDSAATAAFNHNHDGTRMMYSADDNSIRILDVETGKHVGKYLKGHSGEVLSVACNRDGTRIVSGSEDKTIRIWDAETMMQIGVTLKGHSDAVLSVAFNRDGTRIVSGSRDKTIRIWDAETRMQIGKPLRGHSGGVFSVAFTGDGTRIVSGSQDKTIRIWDTLSAEGDESYDLCLGLSTMGLEV